MSVQGALAAVFAIGTLVKVGSQVTAGVQASRAAQQEAALQEEQGRIAREEAQENAQRTADERRKFLKQQKLAFLKSGVSLEGSPLLVLEETRRESQKEVDSIVKRGLAQENLSRRKADITRAQGRAALISGIAGGISSLAQGVFQGRTAGIFNSATTTTGTT